MEIIAIENKSEIQNLDLQIAQVGRRIDDHSRTLRDRKQRLHRRFRNYVSLKRDLFVWIKITKKCPKEAQHLCESHYGGPTRHRIDELRASVSSYRSSLREAKQLLAEIQNPTYIAELKQELALKRQKKARLVATGLPAIQINILQLQHKISKMTGVTKVAFSTTSHQHRLSISLSGLVMSPSDNRDSALYRLKSNVGPDVTDADLDIPLQDCTLDIWLSKDDISKYFFGMDSKVSLPGYEGRSLPHPHWISENSPCLGDFAGAIHEAILAGDLETAATLMIIYLGQYNSEDSAGQYFYRWWMVNNDPRSVPSTSTPFESDEHDDDDHCVDCGNHYDDCSC